MKNTILSDVVAFNIQHADINIINLDNSDEESDLSIDIDNLQEINYNLGTFQNNIKSFIKMKESYEYDFLKNIRKESLSKIIRIKEVKRLKSFTEQKKKEHIT